MADIDEKERLAHEKKCKEEFQELLTKDVDSQQEMFLKSFIFELGEDWKAIPQLAKSFKESCKVAGEGKMDMNHIQAAKFLQENGQTRTALERKRELKDIDINNDGRIAFIEYLLLHYKAMVLGAYHVRHKTECKHDLSKGGKGVTGVGMQLVEELVTIPLNLDPELVKALEDLGKAKKTRSYTTFQRPDKNELEQLLKEDQTKMAQIELSLAAARKKNLKKAKTANKALAAEKAKEAKAKKDASKAKRAAFAARAAMFNK
ncbi:hypothetical protein AAMO2058_001342800 [Amorphochlora amoebiformis]